MLCMLSTAACVNPEEALLQYNAKQGAFVTAVFLLLLMGVSMLVCDAMVGACLCPMSWHSICTCVCVCVCVYMPMDSQSVHAI